MNEMKYCFSCHEYKRILRSDPGTALCANRPMYLLECGHPSTDVTEDMVEPLSAEYRQRMAGFLEKTDEVYL